MMNNEAGGISATEAAVAAATSGGATARETVPNDVGADLERAWDESSSQTDKASNTSDQPRDAEHRSEAPVEAPRDASLRAELERSFNDQQPAQREASSGYKAPASADEAEQYLRTAEQQALRAGNGPLASAVRTILQEELQSQALRFAVEKDASGRYLRPHIHDVWEDMAALIAAARAEGRPITLQDAYDAAVYSNPELREKERAIRAARNPAAAATAGASATVRGELEKAFEAAAGPRG